MSSPRLPASPGTPNTSFHKGRKNDMEGKSTGQQSQRLGDLDMRGRGSLRPPGCRPIRSEAVGVNRCSHGLQLPRDNQRTAHFVNTFRGSSCFLVRTLLTAPHSSGRTFPASTIEEPRKSELSCKIRTNVSDNVNKASCLFFLSTRAVVLKHSRNAPGSVWAPGGDARGSNPGAARYQQRVHCS